MCSSNPDCVDCSFCREMDGFDAGGKRAVVIGATNRKVDLDPALMSRFDLVGAGQNSFAGAQ